MNPEIAQKINELKNDRLHGANWLSVQAINLLSQIRNEIDGRQKTDDRGQKTDDRGQRTER